MAGLNFAANCTFLSLFCCFLLFSTQWNACIHSWEKISIQRENCGILMSQIRVRTTSHSTGAIRPYDPIEDDVT